MSVKTKQFLRGFRNWRQLGTHLMAIALGAAIALSAFQVAPSNASPVNASPTVALQIPQSGRNFVTAAVNQVGPAVVRIDTERTVTRSLPDPFFDDPFFQRFFGDNFPQRFEQEQRQRGQGSGFIINRNGTLITNAHVVNRADRVTVTLKDGRQFQGQVLGTDDITDLALVQIQGAGGDLPAASLGDSEQVQVGDWAIAVGNPLGLDNTVTLGIISTLNRSSSEVGVPDKRLDFIQTDAAINPGNSGGPLLNEQGEVIGINTAIRANAMGIGFAIPINKAKSIAEQLARGEQVSHPYIGVQIANLTPQLAQENNSNPNAPFEVPEVTGVLVVRVMPNTPAAEAGLRRGDVITQINGTTVTTADQLQRIIDRSGVGKSLPITVRRGSQTLQLAVRTAQLSNTLPR
ncbi:trypsin-like peptidase domain-containing protein [Desertifilum sp. FACHB-1129]|uniref:Serine protease n=2 Tax=Desertifilum TaxID=1185872 RepID=A0A1E5QQM3_9CYAN|nr:MULTISPECIES: HhoA/HhoB/HtrA family serine endopeptidase [Desertifilum]MBD2313814.1 trypsin-like peptidase domain-containing protein [Desertifilum sp. FACHB-1129]MBD2323279.1 trypsin-like peptidase domain-containing protein [Desertifilum sp. FACHB-866]MDA0212507.1 trypsin-like peptidase domain-containing protein [Cyanobacteria bacterium FC1]MBD2333124.1 trypsin-like peptidase domain-containing protein [Desertifilum sp. FACHB-868]OEJ76956.1 serine protease [Desertifilum tharense IPPAS B-1220